MKRYLILLTMLTVLASYANDHRVSVYLGHVRGTLHASSMQRPDRIALRALIVVDWEETEVDPDTGLENLTKVAVITAGRHGSFTSLEYTTATDAFAQVPLPRNGMGLILAIQSEPDWQTLMLKGLIGRPAINRTRWLVPLHLRGRNLVYSTVGEPTAENTRFVLRFNRRLTTLSANVADPAAAFDAAVANAEDFAQNLH